MSGFTKQQYADVNVHSNSNISHSGGGNSGDDSMLISTQHI